MAIPDGRTPAGERATEATGVDFGSRGRSRVLTVAGLAVVGVVFAGAGYVAGSAGAPAEEEHGAQPTAARFEAQLRPGEIVELEPMSINLAAGHYLRVAVAFQLVAGIDPDEFLVLESAPARDRMIAVFAGQELGSLLGRDGRERARAELVEAFESQSGPKVLDVYFTEFVMQ